MKSAFSAIFLSVVALLIVGGAIHFLGDPWGARVGGIVAIIAFYGGVHLLDDRDR
jgi:hypothetical protein